MPRRFVVAGSVSQSINVFLQSTSDGNGVISLTTGKIAINYKVGTTGAITTLPTVAANTSDAFTASGTTHGWAELSSVKMPGVYRLDIPDASIASTPDVTFFIQCSTPSTNFIPVAVNIQVISSGGADLPADFITYRGMAQTSVNIGAMLTSVNSKVTSVDTKVSSMNTQVTSILANVTSIDTKVSSMNTQVTSILANVTSINAKVTSVDSRLSSMDTMLSSVNSHVTSIDSRLTSMDTMLTSVNSHVTSADTVANSILTKVTSIDSRLTSMDTMLTSVNSHVTSADTVANSVLTKVTSIDSRLSSMDTMLTSVNTNMLTTSTVHANLYADHLLNRDMSVGTDSGSSAFRTARQSLRFLRNKWDISGTTLSIYKEDDATASWTAVVTTASTDANPISAVDPNGP